MESQKNSHETAILDILDRVALSTYLSSFKKSEIERAVQNGFTQATYRRFTTFQPTKLKSESVNWLNNTLKEETCILAFESSERIITRQLITNTLGTITNLGFRNDYLNEPRKHDELLKSIGKESSYIIEKQYTPKEFENLLIRVHEEWPRSKTVLEKLI